MKNRLVHLGADLYQGKKQEIDDMKAFQILQTKQYR